SASVHVPLRDQLAKESGVAGLGGRFGLLDQALELRLWIGMRATAEDGERCEQREAFPVLRSFVATSFEGSHTLSRSTTGRLPRHPTRVPRQRQSTDRG